MSWNQSGSPIREVKEVGGAFPLWAPCFLVLLLAGCRDRDSGLMPVAGAVTVGGKPLPGAVVEFEPVPGKAGNVNFNPSSKGTTDKKGRFALATPFGSGAVAGEHMVKIWVATETASEDQPGQEGKLKTVLLPDMPEEGLRFTVPEHGTKDAAFTFGATEKLLSTLSELPDGRPGHRIPRTPVQVLIVVAWLGVLRGCYRWWRCNEQRMGGGVERPT